jgi:outer membrane protein assembly factor BamE
MRAILALSLAVMLSGCGLLYKQTVQQGNLLETDQVDALKPGMTKRQVALVLGTPAVQSPFHDNRWDYVSSFKDSDGKIDLKRLTVIFEENVLVRIEGDYEPGKGVHAKGTEPVAADAKSDG